MNGPTIIMTPRRPALIAGFPTTMDVLVRIQAPDMPEDVHTKRPKLNLALVIDRSGSMAGRPLEEAKRCTSFVLERLQPTDRAAVVAYDDSVHVLVPCRPVDDRTSFQNGVAMIKSGGMTDLHAGWLKGAEELSPYTGQDVVSRVLLLSDGQANKGLCDPQQIFAQCEQLAAAGVTTSTYGLGESFNEDLMVGMGRAGLGNSYYGRTAEDLMDPFQEEFALLEALYARNLRLRLELPEGVSAQVLNRYPTDADGALRMPDLAYCGEAWALVRLSIPAGTNQPEPQELIRVNVTYQDRSGTKHAQTSLPLALGPVPAAAWDSIVEDGLVVRRAQELEAADIQEQARTAAARRDWATVERLVRDAKAKAKDNEWLNASLGKLEELIAQRDEVMFRKAAHFNLNKMRSRLAEKDEGMDICKCAPAPYLDRKVEQGKARRQHKAEHTFRMVDGHPIADIDGQPMLIDTGAPVSFGDTRGVELAGRRLNFGESIAGVTAQDISRFVGTHVAAVLGGDVLNTMDIAIDPRRLAVTFGDRLVLTGQELGVEYFMEVPIVIARLCGMECRLVLDTGAKLSYGPATLLNAFPKAGRAKDFYPGIGEFETETFTADLEIVGTPLKLEFGLLPDALQGLLSITGASGILGTQLLDHFRIGISGRRKRLYLDRISHSQRHL